ncbi:hypothetical protein ABFS82_07G016800 [Erythranthe guttata]|uniref:uncharacterized protein LOC105978126 n=1 Tax=Erythranthe guttata TaxID=4155 RepID=UPI00064E06C7|nr:PREDICTED: uncharacterized protein LOC105978126 [Erythranthe guttata]|eukprot:XP_012858998.1 PREDICTED: uncharacterized protein LOC105978126 [Erythranthe guttata]
MTQEPELEEGETCFYKDDITIDPDIALSYIGDKVQSILGHLQKDFEGGVSAENLGSKFGGYGSFLPTYQRSSSIWSHPKSPQGVQNHHLPKSPNLFPEGPSMHISQTSKTTVDGSSIRQKATLLSENVAEACPEKVELPSSKSGNPLKVRIKMGPERVAKYNAEIYNLGLTSPSSSEGYSHDESDGLVSSPNESPRNILEIMTAVPVCGGLLLSPLCEDLLNLVQETGYEVEREHETAQRSSAISIKFLNNSGNKTKFVDKRQNLDKSEDKRLTAGPSSCKQKSLDGKALECNARPFIDANCRPISDTVMESENDVQVKKRKGSKDKVKGRAVSGDSVKYASFEHTFDQSCGKIEQLESKCSSVEKTVKHRANTTKDVSVDHGQGSRSLDKGNCASLKAYSDNSEGEGVKKSMVLKSGLNSTSGEHNGFGIPHTVKGLSFEGEKKSKGNQSMGKLASKTGNGKIRVIQKDVVHTSLERMENPKHLSERPSVAMPKNFNLDTVKVKSAHVDKLKERSSNQNYFEAQIAEPRDAPAPAPTPAPAPAPALDPALAPAPAPVLIEENWVGCDRCEKWRLLPNGRSADQLPDKWVCSMLDWLPGMNSCDISQDDTTNATHALFLVHVPDNQHHNQGHVDGTLPGVIPASALHFDQNHHDFASDQMNKKKLKAKQDIVSTSDPARSIIGKKQLPVKNGISKEGKVALAGVNAANKSDSQLANKPSIGLAKSNKRKGEHVIGGDDANVRKKIKKESAVHDVHGNANLGMVGHSGLPNKAAVKDVKKKSAPKADQITVKKHKDQIQGLPDNKASSIKTCNGGEVAVKKIKLKDYGYSQHQVDKFSVQEDSRDGDFHRDKKSRVSKIEDEFKSSPFGEARVRSSIDKEQKLKKPRAKTQLTIEDIDKLRKDLGCEQLSTAATSSSSKVSDSRKNRASYVKVKGSPEESVCSSPTRMPYPNQVSQVMVDNNAPVVISVKKSRAKNENSQLDSKNKLKSKEETDAGGNNCVPKHPFSDESSLKSVKNGKIVSQRDLGKSGNSRIENQKLSRNSEQNSGQMKVRLELRQNDKKGALCPEKNASGSLKRCSLDSRPVAPSVVGVTSKALRDTTIDCLQNGTENFINNEAEQSVALKNVSASTNLKEAEDVLKEAEQLRSHADLIKNSGFGSESNYEYFKAALKFLHCASLLEACDGSSSKHLEMSPMQMYGAAAQLCKTCAYEYEKSHELAAASLAYKCVEVAYLRLVYCKSSTASRLCHDLQASLQMVPQGESPSSSASDVDNLNNLAIVDKATLSKGSGPHPGNHLIVPRNRPNFVRLLDFTKDVNYAMEAAKKSHDTFAAANQEIEKSQNKEAIISVKKVIDFSFQNVEELVRLVWLAFNTIQGLSGSRG